MSVSQNDALFAPIYIKILMDCGASASIIREDLVSINKFSTKRLLQIDGLQWMDLL